ncbi:hypothetical protein MmiAt1_04010 [Methanimicrococcus sp. At1]|uniref:DUF1700 domain-containing protein n=1 Tax=Methanimicrococcus hacksteinii TaxID=3028293 RepID=A0ABU3VN81_9EURY|nr:DUF1700 domain-containing protein [Methanimicrococcus sp. At1]MDV0444857.1 hypothetical protein [Methanimicrococcus sp. At1]
MNKSEFMAELEAQLSEIDEQERSDAIAFYNEYFEEAGAENEQDVIEELGSPAQVAAQIKADAAVKEIQADTPPVKKGISAIRTVILGILALPVALPLLLLAATIVFVILVIAGALIFALAAFVGAFLFSSFVIMAAGISVLSSDFAVGIFYIGIGLVFIGITWLSAILVYLVSRVMVSGIIKLINYIRVQIQNYSTKKTNRNGDESNE